MKSCTPTPREEKRIYTRFTVEDMDVQTARISRTEVEIHDISPMGISIVGPRKLNIGKEYSVKFGRAEQPVAARGIVKWEMLVGGRKISEEEVLPVYMAGLEFTDVLTARAAPIMDFINMGCEHREQRIRGVRFRITSGEKAVLDCVETYAVKIISLSGMLIEARHDLPVGTAYPMELLLPDEDNPLAFRGRIAYCHGEQKENIVLYRIGIEFSEMAEEDRSRLQGFAEFMKDR